VVEEQHNSEATNKEEKKKETVCRRKKATHEMHNKQKSNDVFNMEEMTVEQVEHHLYNTIGIEKNDADDNNYVNEEEKIGKGPLLSPDSKVDKQEDQTDEVDITSNPYGLHNAVLLGNLSNAEAEIRVLKQDMKELHKMYQVKLKALHNENVRKSKEIEINQKKHLQEVSEKQ